MEFNVLVECEFYLTQFQISNHFVPLCCKFKFDSDMTIGSLRFHFGLGKNAGRACYTGATSLPFFRCFTRHSTSRSFYLRSKAWVILGQLWDILTLLLSGVFLHKILVIFQSVLRLGRVLVTLA